MKALPVALVALVMFSSHAYADPRHYGFAVLLLRIRSPGFQYFSWTNRFCDANGRASRRPRTVLQIQQNHLVAKTGQPGYGAPASVFRVAGMSAGHDYLQPWRRWLRCDGLTFTHCVHQRRSKD
jgi:hypothetical protein